MIKIVHLSSNPISGSPYELNKLLNTYSKHIQSRLIQGVSSYKADKDIPIRTFPCDLLWNDNREECIALIKEADIIHIHNSLFPENLKDYINPTQKIIYQLYSVYRDKLQPIIDSTLVLNPRIVIADQPWQKKVYEDLSIDYLPLVKTEYSSISQNSIPTIVYAPTNKLPLTHPYSKGYYEVLEILYRLKQKYVFHLKIIEGLPYEENLLEKQHADIIIDDVINENAFHGTSLEAACFGAIALTNYSGIDYPFKKTSLQTLEKTLTNYLLNPDLLAKNKQNLKEWQLTHYNSETLVEKYETFYRNCVNPNIIEIDNITNPREQSERMEKAKTYLFQVMIDWLQKNNIPFFLSFGSALKAYRDNEHALDADLGVMIEHKWKIRNMIKEHLPQDIMINCMWRGEITFRLKNSNYPKLDIIFFDKQSDVYRCNIYSKNPLNELITWERGIQISHKALNKFRPITFKDRIVSIPEHIELYLKENYTDEWKIPLPNKSYGWNSRPCADKNHRQIAVIIPTFIRPQKVRDCINSILNLYPDGMIRIYVGDQSDEISPEMLSFYAILESQGHKYFRLPYNCGLAYARNYLIKQVTSEPYILIIDDDFIFNTNTDLSKFIDVLEEKESHGICGGNLENRYHYAGWLSYQPSIQKILKIDIFSMPQNLNFTSDYPYRHRTVSYYYSDIVLNFFLAKKEVFQDIEWDNELVLCEHTDFFMRLKQTKWQVCYAPEVTIKHSSIPNDTTYANFRHRENKQIGIDKFCKKWKLNTLNDIWRLSSDIHVSPDISQDMKIDTSSSSPKPETNSKLPDANLDCINVFRELTQLFEQENVNFCLLKQTCLHVFKHKDFLGEGTEIYLGVHLSEELKKTLTQMNYVVENSMLTKNNISVYLSSMPSQTKRWVVGNKIYKVPFPLVRYLKKEFASSKINFTE